MTYGGGMGFAGDPGHEGGSQPMKSLQGGISGVHTQMPDDQSENYMNRRPQADSPWKGWDTTSIGGGNSGGDTNNSSSDRNGMRTPPSHMHG